jgi:arylsulfatase A-like enzyme
MERRDFLAGLTASFAAGAPQPSNVVVVTADNLGYGDTGCYGNTEIKTPHLDAFARSGVRFTNFYTASPTCTASRAALLTGRHPLRYGLNYQLKPDENRSGIGLPHSEKIIPQYLKRAGYATACFGKWNLGFAPGSQPVVRGFDEFLGIRSGNADYYTHLYRGELDLFQGNQPHRSRTYSTDLFADSACEWLRRVSGQPFFLYLPFSAPHFNSKLNCLPGQKVEWRPNVEDARQRGGQREHVARAEASPQSAGHRWWRRFPKSGYRRWPPAPLLRHFPKPAHIERDIGAHILVHA